MIAAAGKIPPLKNIDLQTRTVVVILFEPDRPRTTPSPYPNDPRDPRTRNPNDPRYPSDPSDTRREPQPGRNDDIISATLDTMYRTADSYLNDLAQKSGGRLYRADTLLSLPDAFAKIAAELSTQYALGYYPRATASKNYQ